MSEPIDLHDEYLRLLKRDRDAKVIIRTLRQLVVAAHQAGEIFVHVELGEGGKRVLQIADRFLEEDVPTCEGCTSAATTTIDADGHHLCRRCGQSLVEATE